MDNTRRGDDRTDSRIRSIEAIEVVKDGSQDTNNGVNIITDNGTDGKSVVWDVRQWLQDRKWKDYVTPNNMLIGLLLGALLLVVALPVTGDRDVGEEALQESGADQGSQGVGSLGNTDDMDTYVAGLEQDFATILEQVAGIRSVQVMITLETSSEAILNKDNPYTQSISSETGDNATKEQTDVENQETTVLVTKDGDSYPYVVKELYPKIEGVLVVVDGDLTPTLRNEIIGVAEVLFGVEMHKVKVLEMEDKGDYR